MGDSHSKAAGQAPVPPSFLDRAWNLPQGLRRLRELVFDKEASPATSKVCDVRVRHMEEGGAAAPRPGGKTGNGTGSTRRVLSFDREGVESPEKAREVAAPDNSSPATPPSPRPHKALQPFSLKYLHSATNGFGKGSLIGDGSYGRVYKALLLSGEAAVVMVPHGEVKIEESEFRKHMAALGSLQCKQLVSILGYCCEMGQRLLVYEHMANASLKDHLHGDLRFGRHLDWSKRLTIAHDIACALSYLHNETNPALFHSDVRSSSVLLDSSFRAKLADYGMPFLVKNGAERAVSPHVLGSFVYQAPEYRTDGCISAKGDVYSFGVVLLELLTGRTPLDSTRPKGQQSLLTWMLPLLDSTEAVATMVDPYLRLNSGAALTEDSIMSIASLASRCLQHGAEGRPSMAAVKQALHSLVHKEHSEVVHPRSSPTTASELAEVTLGGRAAGQESSRSSEQRSSGSCNSTSTSPFQASPGPSAYLRELRKKMTPFLQQLDAPQGAGLPQSRSRKSGRPPLHR